MAVPLIETSPLPSNFPQDFLPDRSLISRLLAFAVRNGGGTKVEIGAETGIPTGKSTGKVEPMIHYARGMGLVAANKLRGRWELRATYLGEVVHREDRYLDEPVTLWLLHLLLCRRAGQSCPASGIADAWFALFADGATRLGNPFNRSVYLTFLNERQGQMGYLRTLSSLVPRSYIEASCLGPINALSVAKPDIYCRHPAPDGRAFFPAYTAALFLAWDSLYPDQQQISLDQLFRESRLIDIMGWNRTLCVSWFAWMVNRGCLQLDELTGSAIALRLCETEQSIRGLYDESI